MNLIELNTKMDLFRRELRFLESIKPNCSRCEHGVRSGWCEKHQAVPPSDVVQAGCDQWTFNEIPF